MHNIPIHDMNRNDVIDIVATPNWYRYITEHSQNRPWVNNHIPPLIARFMGPTWSPPGADRTDPLNFAVWDSMLWGDFSRPNFIGGLAKQSLYGWFWTHWGRGTHICFSKRNIIGSDNGLPPSRGQAIIWTNDGILSVHTIRPNFSELLYVSILSRR